MRNWAKYVPSFAYIGGKARLRWDLVDDIFPITGTKYLEPFAGRANVFYLAYRRLQFDQWHLNDLYSYPFFKAILEVDFSKLPEKVSREDFEQYRTNKDDPISILLENQVSVMSKGYDNGYRTDNRYKRALYIKRLEIARNYLKMVTITDQSFETLNYNEYNTRDDFIYFDPPYTIKRDYYGSIDHEKLIEICNNLSCKYAISGYDNPLYAEKLKFKQKNTFVRNLELSGMGMSKKEEKSRKAFEIVWKNY